MPDRMLSHDISGFPANVICRECFELSIFQSCSKKSERYATMGLLPNEEEALKELKIALEKNYQLLDFRVFGSKARGIDVKDSDLDVMIVLEEHSPKIESRIDDLIFDINLKYECFITAIFFSRKELEAGPMSESPIYKKIMREGISL